MIPTKCTAALFATLLLAIVLPLSAAHAQDDTANPLQSGSRALQFHISENFTLGSFSGSLFSYKRQLSDMRAERIGLSLGNRYAWSNYPDNDNRDKSTDLDLHFGVDYSWMHYTNLNSDIKFYYGYGPGIDFGLDKSVQESTNRTSTTRTTLYGVNGLGYAGVEWFFQSSMSLHAEYRTSLRVTHRREKDISVLNDTEETESDNTTSVRLGGNGVRFGLSVYF